MELIPNQNLANPNACAICEETPVGDSVLDVERYFPFNPTYPLNGRKYVCARCGGEIANKFGFASDSQIAVSQASNEAARQELGNVRARVTELADHIKEFVNSSVGLDPAASQAAVAKIVDASTSASAAALASAATDVVAAQEDPAPEVNSDAPVFEDGVQVVNEDAKAVDEAKVEEAAKLDEVAASLVEASTPVEEASPQEDTSKKASKGK